METSKCLTPTRLREALNCMIAAGLKVDSFEKTLELLFEINQTAPSSRRALEIFSEIYPEGSRCLEKGLDSFKTPLPAHIPLTPAEGAIELLEYLVKEHTLALVTIGYAQVQHEKMKKAGIQPHFFSKIIVGDGTNKRPYYEEILKEFNAKTGLVCGDRVHLDLKPAKELGLCTVHIRAGRGLQQVQCASDIDFAIGTLAELKEIINITDSRGSIQCQ